MITFTGSPEVGWGIKARAPRKKVGLELGNNAPLIIEPSADVETAAKKVVGRRLQPRGPVVHLDAAHLRARDGEATRSSTRSSRSSKGSSSATRSTSSTDVSALISTGERDRVTSLGRRSRRRRAPRCSPAARSAKTACSMPTVLGNVTPDMKVCAHEVFGPVVGVADLRRPRRRASRSRTTRATGSRPRSSPPTSTTRCARLARSTSAACS